jgi:hypothetical protein
MSITKYQRSDVAGEEWMRAARIIFENPPSGEFKVRFAEERAIALSDGTVMTKPVGVLEDGRNEDQLEESFELVDPATGEGSGSFMTYAQLHAALYSLYLKASVDHHGAPPETEPTDPPAE